jgi:hypothetical protein
MTRRAADPKQTSWTIQSSHVGVSVTHIGAQLAPVRFRLGDRWVEPLSIAPWADEDAESLRALPPMLRILRGDFFACPFGGNTQPYRGERHPPHGEPANALWAKASEEDRCLSLRLKTRARRGEIRQNLRLVDGHTAIYIEHALESMTGKMSVGRHLMVRCRSEGRLTIGGFTYGRTPAEPIERPENRGYSLLSPGQRFDDLSRVSTVMNGVTDLTYVPSTRGFEDLVQCAADPETPFGWAAIAFPAERFLLFTLKDRRALPTTILWLSNGGRHYAPWNGRHVDILGLEDVCSNFHHGLAESARPNAWNDDGIATTLRLSSKRPTRIGYVIGVAAIPRAFGRVASLSYERHGETCRLTFIDEAGRRVSTMLSADFVDSLSTD